jgi:hypothetical protein
MCIFFRSDGSDSTVDSRSASFAFRCPPGCDRILVGENYFVGLESAQYRTLVIGGPESVHGTQQENISYRGDSFICASAVHAGIVQKSEGGCGILRSLGARDNYPGSDRNGVTSFVFDSTFPVSYNLSSTNIPCVSLRWAALSVSITLTGIVSIFTTSPAVFYSFIFVVGFWQVSLVSNPPEYDDYSSVIQWAMSNFLPACFVAWAVYVVCIRRTLRQLDAPLEKTVLWLGAFWIGALDNMTFDKLPLQRLTARDLTQPGAKAILVVVIILIASVGVYQAWSFWSEGRLRKFLVLYTAIGIGLGLLAALPEMNLRIHHYILALLLLPATAVQTRPSLIIQGLLFGLFINGVARWGFASIIETDQSLSGNGQIVVSAARPMISQPFIAGANITFNFANYGSDWDGINIKMNDVDQFSYVQGVNGTRNFTVTREKDEPLYFRFGFFKTASPYSDFLQGDYTDPAVWRRNGSWVRSHG